LILRLLVARIQIGMKLACKFAIGLLYVIGGCTATDAEYFVIVFRLDSHKKVTSEL